MKDNHITCCGNVRESGYGEDDYIHDYLEWYDANESCLSDYDTADEYEGLTIIDHPHITGCGSIVQFRIED